MQSGGARRRKVTRVSRKNQVTLPVAALAQARIKAGDQLRVEAAGDGRITLIRERDMLEELAGSLPGLSKATNLEALRNEWAR